MSQFSKFGNPYFKSVRFFKHLILCILIALILVPSVSCIIITSQNNNLQNKITELHEIVATESTTRAELETQLKTLQQQNTQEVITPPDPFDFEQPYYTELYPDMIFDNEIEYTDPSGKSLYITFDDGPSPVTDDILDVLAEKNVKATFFVLGNQLENADNQARLKRIVAEGHTIGIHTYSHNLNKIYVSVESYLDDFYKVWTKVYDITGQKVDIFRFAGGSINPYNITSAEMIIPEMLRRGFVYFDWNSSSADSVKETATVKTIYNAATNTWGYAKVVLLMHDSNYKDTTAEALPSVIDFYIEEGYTPRTLSQSVKPVIYKYKY